MSQDIHIVVEEDDPHYGWVTVRVLDGWYHPALQRNWDRICKLHDLADISGQAGISFTAEYLSDGKAKVVPASSAARIFRDTDESPAVGWYSNPAQAEWRKKHNPADYYFGVEIFPDEDGQYRICYWIE